MMKLRPDWWRKTLAGAVLGWPLALALTGLASGPVPAQERYSPFVGSAQENVDRMIKLADLIAKHADELALLKKTTELLGGAVFDRDPEGFEDRDARRVVAGWYVL